MLGRFLPRWRAAGAVAVILVVGGMAAAAVSARSDATDKGTIAIMFPNASQPIVVRVLDVAKQEAKRRGYEFLINDPGNDLNKQVGVIETWIVASLLYVATCSVLAAMLRRLEKRMSIPR